MRASSAVGYDFITPYVNDLAKVLFMDAIRASGIRVGVDPLGGAAVGYWQHIAEQYNLNLTVVNKSVDPTFSFMTVDHDGKIRMDCSSPFAMASLVGLKDKFDIAFGNDPDSDRHGIDRHANPQQQCPAGHRVGGRQRVRVALKAAS